MDSVIMTTPGNSTRLKSRLRNAASTFLARNSKSRSAGNRNHTVNHKNIRNNVTKTNSFKNNINLRHSNGNRNIPDGNHDTNGNSAPENNMNSLYQGKYTREVYNTICGRLGQALYIPEDSVQALFNDMHLYPSKSQVSEMLHCARQCSCRNGTSPFLTFGEFCVFAREMQKSKLVRNQPSQKTAKCVQKCEVFLGGSCNPTTWRADIAIPELQKHGISYYNPQVSMWAPELVAEEHDAKQSAFVLLFVVDSQTRSVGGMIEVAYLAAAGRCVVVVAQPYQVGQSIMGETISEREYKDLVNAHAALLAFIKDLGVKVHTNLTSALQRTANILRNSSVIKSSEPHIIQKLRKLREAFDSYDIHKTGEIRLNDVLDAYYHLTNKSLRISDLYSYLSATNNTETARLRISFEQFCALVAEFSSGGCDTSVSNEWANQSFQRQCSTNNNSHCDPANNHENCSIQHDTAYSDDKDVPLADVFLGGSCKTNLLWRENIAIPLLKKHGLTYYNPAVREIDVYNNFTNGSTNFSDDFVAENSILEWKRIMDKSRILLFVVTNETRSLTSMILAAYYIGRGKDVILCVQNLPAEECELENERLSKQAIKDYNRGRVYLADFAKRKQLPVFDNITESVQYAINKLQVR